MRSVLLSCFAALALIVLAGAVQADTETDAILVKAIEAHGGREALAKYGAVRMKWKVILAGNDATPKEWTVLFAAPGKLKEVREGYYLGKRNDSVWITDEKGSWQVLGGKASPAMAKLAEFYKGEVHLIQVLRLVPLQGKGYELAAVDGKKVSGKPTVGLRVRAKGQMDVTLFFDKESGLLAKVERLQINTSYLEQMVEERFYKDYPKTDPKNAPIAVARNVTVLHNGNANLKIEVQDVKFLEKFEKDEFRR
jgi:hypothetical protein